MTKVNYEEFDDAIGSQYCCLNMAASWWIYSETTELIKQNVHRHPARSGLRRLKAVRKLVGKVVGPNI